MLMKQTISKAVLSSEDYSSLALCVTDAELQHRPEEWREKGVAVDTR